jgi:general secretion pathway protein D
MNPRPRLTLLLATALTVLLAACTSMPAPKVQRAASRPPPARVAGVGVVQQPLEPDAAAADATPRPIIRRGTGQVINRGAASAPQPNLGGSSGAATFNFEGESLQAVVKAILGDMLGQNYVIAPGVQGTVTLATPKPVSPAEARSLLEMVLGWNNARMIYSDGRYNIVPADQALAGTVAPRTGSPDTARGFESRVVPLRYVSAAEMEKILKPYARANAIVNVDSGRNVITVAGTRAELENYLRTIEIFDVDWMSSMSVGVFPLQSGKATQVVQDLERVFGEQSKSPVAGMFRFMPLEASNAVLVITPQPDYLDNIQQWLERIDGAGEGPRLFSYELKYIKAKDLADRLADVFGGGGNRSEGNTAPSLMPGLESTEIRDSGVDDTGNSSAGIGGDTGGGMGEGAALNPSTGGNGTVTLEVEGDKVGVSAVDETNTLLVRSSPQAWKSIREVIERLDVMPLQVQIEAQVAEVTLSGDLKYGVSWYFENALTGVLGVPVGSGIRANTGGEGLIWSFPGNGALGVINALDQVTDVQLLQTPSVVVRNNAEATLNVGTRIPINSVSFNPGGNNNNGTFSQVQYLDTGVILKVRPRVTKDGVVFLDIVQEVSSPGPVPAGCATNANNCNVAINTRKLKTQAAIQSGDTVMLAGLISDTVDRNSSGIPGLSRIPVLGALFGTQGSRTGRNEVIVLLTPTVIRNPLEAANLTDEYSRRFRAMEPLYRTPKQR